MVLSSNRHALSILNSENERQNVHILWIDSSISQPICINLHLSVLKFWLKIRRHKLKIRRHNKREKLEKLYRYCRTARNDSNRQEMCNGFEQPSHFLGVKGDQVMNTLVNGIGIDWPLDKEINQQTVFSFVSVVTPYTIVTTYTVLAHTFLKDIQEISGPW